jgi:hypothetical protein
MKPLVGVIHELPLPRVSYLNPATPNNRLCGCWVSHSFNPTYRWLLDFSLSDRSALPVEGRDAHPQTPHRKDWFVGSDMGVTVSRG